MKFTGKQMMEQQCRTLMHDDGNIKYANYQSKDQMTEFLTAQGHSDVIGDII